MDLIPGLPNDIGLQCLIRLPYTTFPFAVSVSRFWKSQFQLPHFPILRKSARFSRRILLFVQSRVDPTRRDAPQKHPTTSIYRLTVYDPKSGHWSELPSIPGFSDGLPRFCRVSAVGYRLVVVGGLNPENWGASNAVFVYDFVSATWRRGSDMPGCTRSFFGCASDNERRVVVAGGHDGEKNALRSGLMYDVADDTWVSLPDMADERDECKVVFHRGKFHVIGGYKTETQGQFGKSAEAYDPGTGRWDPVEEEFLGAATCPTTLVGGGDERLYMYDDGGVVAVDDGSRRMVTRMPSEVDSVVCLVEWECGRILAVGSVGYGGGHRVYVLDLEKYTWTTADVPEEFSGHIQSGSWLEI